MTNRGPWCTSCGHEYRTKDRKPEPFAEHCPYCGARGGARLDRKPFVEMSKSQIEKWGLPGDEFGCPARWFFKHVLHRPEPKNKYAEFGIAGHGLAENYLLRGEMPQVNSLDPKSTQTKAAMSLLGGIPHMIPPTLPGVQVESEFHYEFEGVRYMGYKDVWAPLSPITADVPDRMRFSSGGSSVIGDWKFVGRRSFDQFTPIPEKLAIDLQGTIEAFDDVRRGASKVWLNWVYMPRGERLGKPVRAIVDVGANVRRMREINSVAKQILHVLALPGVKVQDMPTNAGACQAYGSPCPYLSECHVLKDQQIAAGIASAIKLGENTMQGFPGTPQPGALGALVASLPNSQPTPPPAAPQANPFAPPPALPAAPAEPSPESVWAVEWQSQRYDVPFKKLQEIQKSGTPVKVLGPVQANTSPLAQVQATPTAAPFQPPAQVQPPAPVTAPSAPPVAAPTSPIQPVAGKRGRKSKTVETPAPVALSLGANPAPSPGPITEPDESPDDDDEIVDAINHVLEAFRVSLRVYRP